MFSTKVRFLAIVVFVAYIQTSHSGCPGGAKIGAFEGKEIEDMLNEHNDRRAKISKTGMKCKINQPKSKEPLDPLKWDEALAVEACKICSKCEMDHMEVEGDLKEKHGCVGQNLWNGPSDKETANAAGSVQSWTEECHAHNIRKKGASLLAVGHWTQVIWSNTKFIGCCKSSYKKNANDANYTQLIACNYGPCGNMKGQSPYEV